MQQPNPRINILPARRGWQWLMQAGDLIGRYYQVFLWLALLWAAISLIWIVPIIGPVFLLLLTPGLQAGVMYAFARADRNEKPQSSNLFAVLNGPARSMVIRLAGLLLLWLVLAVIMLSIAAVILLPELGQITDINQLQLSDLPIDRVWLLMSLVLIVFAVISLALFFAIPRVAFDQLAPAAAVLESIRASLLNWRALLLFGLAQVVVSAAAIIMMSLLLSAITLIGGAVAVMLENLILNMFLMLLQVLVCGGQYLAWKDVFEHNEADQNAGRKPPSEYDQLIA